MDRISEAQSSIETKEEEIRHLEKVKNHNVSLLNRFFTKRYNESLFRTALKQWFIYKRFESRKNRIAAYTSNVLRRRKTRLVFGSWRGVTH